MKFSFMKKICYPVVLVAIAFSISSCGKSDSAGVVNPIKIASPSPEEQISRVALEDSQIPFVTAGNEFAIKCLKTLYDNENLVFSPLSLQYALALTANGASGETAGEIVRTLGFGEDKAALNAYCNLLLRQLPAVDTKVDLKLANAVVMNDKFKAQESFRQIAETVYYSPVEYASLSKPKELADRINEWAGRNTNGLINPFIDENSIDENFVSAILNALYFKARWRGSGTMPAFTAGDDPLPFYLDGGGSRSVKYMFAENNFRYGKLGENSILELPYENGKYVMYVILPDSKGSNGLSKLLASLSADGLFSASMSSEAMIHVKLPVFETAGSLELRDLLTTLGVSRAFNPNSAEFDRFVENHGTGDFFIGRVLQKARIKVTEWGTEAAAVTMVEIGDTDFPVQMEEIYFSADHPFVYVIAEKTSGVILFEGIFNGVD